MRERALQYRTCCLAHWTAQRHLQEVLQRVGSDGTAQPTGSLVHLKVTGTKGTSEGPTLSRFETSSSTRIRTASPLGSEEELENGPPPPQITKSRSKGRSGPVLEGTLIPALMPLSPPE